MNRASIILEAQHLSRRVENGEQARTIVDDFSFAFEPGKVYSLLGPSGAGKTSLLRLFNRLDEPTAGDVIFDGSDFRTVPPWELRRKIGFLFQVPFLFPGTVADNLRTAEATLTDDQIDQLLIHASVDPGIRKYPIDNLSLGEKQRIALARVLATKPAVILLDEPTAALDPTYTERIESSVRNIAEQDGLAVIIVSHQPQQALRLGGEGLLIVAGKLVEHGPVQNLVENPQTDLGRRYRDRKLT
jgi:putative ABC transport system ATP-binding protein